MLPAPRIGSTWARPNTAPWRATAATTGSRLRKPRSISARRTISSTNGAATTAVTSNVMTYVRSRSAR